MSGVENLQWGYLQTLGAGCGVIFWRGYGVSPFLTGGVCKLRCQGHTETSLEGCLMLPLIRRKLSYAYSAHYVAFSRAENSLLQSMSCTLCNCTT